LAFDIQKNVTSQCGEDGIIEEIFTIIKDGDKWCVEFGAWDGKQTSNTWNLIQNKGWAGIAIAEFFCEFDLKPVA